MGNQTRDKKSALQKELNFSHQVLAEVRRSNSLKGMLHLFKNFGINKIEADYQSPDSSALFFKRYNQNGLYSLKI